MVKSLSFIFEPTPFWASTAEGSLAGAVISVLPTMPMSPVALMVNRGVHGAFTAENVCCSRTPEVRCTANRESASGAGDRRRPRTDGARMASAIAGKPDCVVSCAGFADHNDCRQCPSGTDRDG